MRRVGLMVFAIMLLAGCSRSQAEPGTSGPSPVPGPRVTITIDPFNGITFAPAPPSAHPTLTGQEAFDRYGRKVGAKPKPIPADVTVQLGLLTIPQGGASPYPGEEYTARNQLVWAFSIPIDDCPRTERPPEPGQTPPSPSPIPGVEWEFLDANTGEQIESTCQLLTDDPTPTK